MKMFPSSPIHLKTRLNLLPIYRQNINLHLNLLYPRRSTNSNQKKVWPLDLADFFLNRYVGARKHLLFGYRFQERHSL